MRTFLSSLTWFLALLIPAMSLGMLLFIKISIWRDERDALKEIRKAGKDV
jgi:uncharacterized membrane protein